MGQRNMTFKALFYCLVVLLLPVWAHALNLGDIRLESSPDQPLEATILLSEVSADEQDNLSIGLADEDGFRWAGITWTPALDRLQFELKRSTDGSAYIRIYSSETLRLPRLHFLLQIAWPKGRLFRDYTLELNGPAYRADTKPKESVQQPTAVSPARHGRDDTGTGEQFRESYRVVRNDTLWMVASRLRRDTSISIQQMMLALLRTNSDAFGYGNINWLRQGAVLQVPEESQLWALSASDAYAEVLAQNRFWQETRAGGLPGTGLQPIADTAAHGVETAATEPALRLVAVSPEDIKTGNGAVAGSDGIVRSEDPVMPAEGLVTPTRENAELGSKLSEASATIERLQRLLELKDDELTALQRQVLSKPEAAGPGPDLWERLKSFFVAATGSTYRLLTDYWYLALAAAAILLALTVLSFRGRQAEDIPKEEGLSAAELDFWEQVAAGNVGTTAEAGQDPLQQTGPEIADTMAETEAGERDTPQQTGPEIADTMAETETGERDTPQQTGPEIADTMAETEAGEWDTPQQTDPETADTMAEDEAGERDASQQTDLETADTMAEDEIGKQDKVNNKLDLARAYLELGDPENARSILYEVLSEGTAAQRQEARQLLAQDAT